METARASSGTFGSADALVSGVVRDPVQVVGDPGVHSRVVFPGASLAPGHYACVWHNNNNNSYNNCYDNEKDVDEERRNGRAVV